ncbi:MAG: hypothetical protein ACT4OZ_08920 [Gemmatimonadota bacterium]
MHGPTKLATAVGRFRETPDDAARRHLLAVANASTPDALVAEAERFLEDPSVTAVLYQVIVDAQPRNARAIVILANALWLLGAGPEAVNSLAEKARSIDAGNRGAWHLWALSEPSPRARTERWSQVVKQFPTDDLALANLADNASAVASAERDYASLDVALDAYEQLLARAPNEEQRNAVDTALKALRGWRF